MQLPLRIAVFVFRPVRALHHRGHPASGCTGGY